LLYFYIVKQFINAVDIIFIDKFDW